MSRTRCDIVLLVWVEQSWLELELAAGVISKLPVVIGAAHVIIKFVMKVVVWRLFLRNDLRNVV